MGRKPPLPKPIDKETFLLIFSTLFPNAPSQQGEIIYQQALENMPQRKRPGRPKKKGGIIYSRSSKVDDKAKVYRATVAWVRHNKMEWDNQLERLRDDTDYDEWKEETNHLIFEFLLKNWGYSGGPL